jgi:hypothetical protein
MGKLEQWNNGKMGFGIMGKWYIGKTILTRCETTEKVASILWLYRRFSIISLFHHSIIPCAGQRFKAQTNTFNFNKL